MRRNRTARSLLQLAKFRDSKWLTKHGHGSIGITTLSPDTGWKPRLGAYATLLCEVPSDVANAPCQEDNETSAATRRPNVRSKGIDHWPTPVKQITQIRLMRMTKNR